MKISVERLYEALMRRVPGPIHRPLNLHKQRREQKRKNLNYVSKDGDLQDLKLCDSQSKLFAFAEDKFGVVQNKSEIVGLLDLLNLHQPKIACEIGTNECGTLFLFTHAVEGLNKVAAIDILFQQKIRFEAMQQKEHQVRFIEGYSTAKRTRRQLEVFLNGSLLDFLFIDGDHSYEGCKADFLIFKKYVKEGGLIAFHDIVPDITTQKGSSVRLSKSYAGGVHRLWDELKKQYKYHEYVESWEQDGLGIGVVEYSSKIKFQ